MATEMDAKSFENCKEIIEKNKLEKYLEIRKSDGQILNNIIKNEDKFAFLMCNPPFFEDEKSHKQVK